MNNWQPGTTLNNRRYSIEKTLGEGGFGITYLAWDNQNIGTKVVIKTLNSRVQKLPNFDKFQKRFIHEAEQLKKFQHQNIVKFYHSFQEGKLYCIVMEFIEGDNLADVINQQGILPPKTALYYIQQIANALIVIHNKKILHRDIKPENIILRKNTPEVVLIDFGIARDFIPNQTNSFTQFYTPGYAPIEQYTRKHKPGEYTDIYALAATLYVLLTNYQLPNSIDRYHTQLAIHKTPLPKQFRFALKLIFKLIKKPGKQDLLIEPKKINTNISDRLNNAIIKGMEIQPEDRPQTVQEWLTLLQVKPPSIMSQMSQVSGKIMSQMATLNIQGIKPLYQNYVKTFYQGEANILPIGTGILIFIVVTYIYSPKLKFPKISRPLPLQPIPIPQQKHHPTIQPQKAPQPLPGTNIPDTSQTTINYIEKKVDYTTLENLLSSEKFQEADQETFRIILSLVELEKEYWLNLEDIKNIPCKDLDKINQLWINYSNGKFGFSIQKQIWSEVGGKPGIYNVAIADIFIKEVEWGEKYKRYKNITYKISAPYGHLPFRATSYVRNFGAPYLAEKLAKCNI
ncbi:serine/threonine-protein kinase [Okeania sp. SIO2B3]|uniref:serine/threonine-protein kinase n=1 Tax=Okeania sp. SIO2B3 TaxID=2607784 RepID=UPI0013C1923B|nr:serine/threonine-protein kinase [Okeania sp. SIO2B3]NET42251.1 protein kinase [Okeania sp. SIO2B3]